MQGRTKVERRKRCRCLEWVILSIISRPAGVRALDVKGEGGADHVHVVKQLEPSSWSLIRAHWEPFRWFQSNRSAERAMALLTNGAQNLGSYFCLIRHRFKRRRKKRSERKGNSRSSDRATLDLLCRLHDTFTPEREQSCARVVMCVKFEVVKCICSLLWDVLVFLVQTERRLLH